MYLSLGANLGDRLGNLHQTLTKLNEQSVTVMRKSSFYETEPQELKQQPWFVNMAVACSTTLQPPELLAAIQGIEKDLGRDRTAAAIRRGPRLIDIDILLYGSAIIQTAELVVPHPRMMERRFVLEPLFEIAPDLRDPVSGVLLSDRLANIGAQVVRRLQSSGSS